MPDGIKAGDPDMSPQATHSAQQQGSVPLLCAASPPHHKEGDSLHELMALPEPDESAASAIPKCPVLLHGCREVLFVQVSRSPAKLAIPVCHCSIILAGWYAFGISLASGMSHHFSWWLGELLSI